MEIVGYEVVEAGIPESLDSGSVKCTPLFAYFLPTKKQLDQRAYDKGKRVSFLRRTIAFVFDFIVLAVALYFFRNHYLKYVVYFIMVIFYFGLMTYLFKGQTLGMKLVKIGLQDENKEKPLYFQYIKRYGSLLAVIYLIPCLLIDVFYYTLSFDGPLLFVLWIILGIIIFFYVILVFKMILMIIIRHDLAFYEKLSKTYCYSLVYNKYDQDNNS